MKWFKHFSNAHNDTRIRRLIRKYGLRGYGLYFACVEMISYQLDPDSPNPELEDSARDIAEMFGEDTALIEDILHYCIYDQKLFDVDENTGRLICFKLLHHLDNTLSNNPEIRKIISNFNKLKETSSNLKQIRLDKIREDKTILDNNKTVKKDEQFELFWNTYNKKVGRPICEKKWSKLSQADKEKIFDHLRKYIPSTPDQQYRKNPSTYLNQECWNDEVIQKPQPKPAGYQLLTNEHKTEKDFDTSIFGAQE